MKKLSLFSFFAVLFCLVSHPVPLRADESDDVPLFKLVKAPELQADLKLSDADFRKFSSLFNTLSQMAVEINDNFPEPDPRDGSTAELEKYFNEEFGRIRKETQNVRKALQQLLTEEQYEKFSMRVVQVYVGMPVGYMFVDLFDALELTDDQKQKLADHYENHILDRIRDHIRKVPAETARQRTEQSQKKFDGFMSPQQQEKMNDLCLNLMPSYVRVLIFPEELTEYDSLHEPSNAVPRAVRLSLTQAFNEGFCGEVRLTRDERARLPGVLEQTGKKFQFLYRDYEVNLRSGMKPDEALQTWIRGQVGIYVGFNKELREFLTPEKRKLLLLRMTQLASNDLIMSCVFLCEELEVTNDNRRNAMLYEYKTIKGYRELTADAKTPQQLQAAKQKYAEYKKQCMKEFAADWTDAQQTTFISKIMQGRPDYVNQVNNAEDGTN